MAGIAGLLTQLQSAFDTTNQQLNQSLERIKLLEEQARQVSQPSIGGSVPATPGPADGSAQPGFSAEPGVPPGLGQIEGGFDNRVPISTMPTPSIFGGGRFPGSGGFGGFPGFSNRQPVPFGNFGQMSTSQPASPLALSGLGAMFGNIFRGRM